MSTRKDIDQICVVVLVLTLVITILFMNGTALGIQTISQGLGYENRIFDTSRVHTVDIIMDDWDGFIETCENEEYAVCSIVIDGESYKNVGIRAKGNTSLHQVSAMNSNRYSFKIEFDHYDSTKTYHGLDKLSLNNLIQDTTYMKDFLTYQMMGSFGVDAPLCSYVSITVNGKDWGLYLAVEGVEDAFLQRNYGNNYGELYKPDSMGFGGGRGNGRDFNFEDFINSAETETDSEKENDQNNRNFGGMMRPNMFEGFNPPSMFSGGLPDDFDPSSIFDGELPEDFEPPSMFGGLGSGAVHLKYIDDDPGSYANIFENAKTSASTADQNRLIKSLKKLSNGEDLESVIDMDEVLRYFVVHNFVVNGDSYTGSMVHNYYLYEEDGRLSMIPWDYNLAFGTFSFLGGDAGSAINDPIDTPLSVSGNGDRPMADWISSSEEYTELYHQYFSEFLNTTDFAAIIDTTAEMIAPYVEKDTTAFYSYDAFQTGVATLREFCLLRAESVQGQLDGIIPSTDEGQASDSSTLIDASALDLSAMGSMNMGGMRFGMGGNRGEIETESFFRGKDNNFIGGWNGADSETQIPGSDFTGNGMPQISDDGFMHVGNRRGGGPFMQRGQNQVWPQDSTTTGVSTISLETLVLLGVSVLALLGGILIALKVKH